MLLRRAGPRLARRLARSALCSLLWLPRPAARPAADALPERAVHVADYDMRVRLDPEAKTLEGQERIVWRNPAPEPVGRALVPPLPERVQELEEHVLRGVGTGSCAATGWRGTAGAAWRSARSGGRTASTSPRGDFEHPDDDNADDRTVWRVPLPEPVPPGGEIALDIAFDGELPRDLRPHRLLPRLLPRRASGFPKLGVYEPAGRRGRASGGWNCHQFHANSEFYADFGHYRVELTLPERFVVGATGKRIGRAPEPRRHVHRTSSSRETCIDFAWTASPAFLEVKATFSAEKDVTAEEYAETARLLGRSLDEVRLSDVEVTVAAPARARGPGRPAREGGEGGDQVVRPLVRALPVPDPDRGRPRVRGRGLGRDGIPDVHHRRDVVAVQPVAVRPGPRPGGGHRARVRPPVLAELVASNEFEESWLDEGFNSYSTGKVMERVYGPWMLQVLGLRLGELEGARAAELGRPHVRSHPDARPGATRPATTPSTPTLARSSPCSPSRPWSGRRPWPA